ncbi:MAG TPA: hypothetical protein VK420_09215 [Longimicrobium sp.]|nr:hypothetical protein [Longimicrobium sp.]
MTRWMPFVLLCSLASPAAAQVKRVLTVGDRIVSVVEIPIPAGSRLEVSFANADSSRVQAIGRVKIEPGARATATLVAWTPGPATGVAARGRIIAADGSVRTVPLRFGVPAVRSVLPRDTAQLKPKPPKDVIGPDRRIDWRLVAAGAALAAWLLVLLYWLRRRRLRPRPEPIVAPTDAREQALEALEAARTSGLAERGDGRAFYTLVAAALRGFAHAVRPRWSPDLTTSELERRMERDGVAARDLGPLRSVLHTADLAKFGRFPVPADTALRDWDEARRWVESFGRDARAPREEEARR